MAVDRILPYLDIPLQHASPRILEAMRQPAAGERRLARIADWRKRCPELVIRSTFIVGFPGETESDFESLLEFLEAARLDRVGELAGRGCHGQCPSQSATAGASGKTLGALDGRSGRDQPREAASARRPTANGAGGRGGCGLGHRPQLCGCPRDRRYRHHTWALQPGDFIEVEVTTAGEHDLWARPIED